jgi:hypothetical protein
MSHLRSLSCAFPLSALALLLAIAGCGDEPVKGGTGMGGAQASGGKGDTSARGGNGGTGGATAGTGGATGGGGAAGMAGTSGTGGSSGTGGPAGTGGTGGAGGSTGGTGGGGTTGAGGGAGTGGRGGAAGTGGGAGNGTGGTTGTAGTGGATGGTTGTAGTTGTGGAAGTTGTGGGAAGTTGTAGTMGSAGTGGTSGVAGVGGTGGAGGIGGAAGTGGGGTGGSGAVCVINTGCMQTGNTKGICAAGNACGPCANDAACMAAYGSTFYCELGACVVGECRLTSECAANESCNAALACVCNANFNDCDGLAANGCESMPAIDVNNCGTCQHACPSTGANVASAKCAASTCGFNCNPNFGDCDGLAANGCEASTSNDTGNCGMCGHACPASGANVLNAKCTTGSCGFNCSPGFADCDFVAANGCETNTNTTSSCGMCGHSLPVDRRQRRQPQMHQRHLRLQLQPQLRRLRRPFRQRLRNFSCQRRRQLRNVRSPVRQPADLRRRRLYRRDRLIAVCVVVGAAVHAGVAGGRVEIRARFRAEVDVDMTRLASNARQRNPACQKGKSCERRHARHRSIDPHHPNTLAKNHFAPPLTSGQFSARHAGENLHAIRKVSDVP